MIFTVILQPIIAVRPVQWRFTLLQFFVGFSFIIVWLPLLRCLMDGSSYSWGMKYFGISFFSTGITEDYFLLPLFLLGYTALFWSFYYAKKRGVFYAMLVLWWVHFFGNFLYEILTEGDTEFHGDTLNIHISLSTIIIPIAVLAALLIVSAITWDLKQNATALAWNQRNKRGLYLILAMLAVQWILFAFGEPHGLTDQVGVVIAIVQSFAIPLVFRPYSLKR